MRAIIIGGTGATGRELVLQLLADPRVETVTALVRRPFFPPDSKLREVVINFDRLQDYSDLIEADVAFTTLGTTLKNAGSKESQWHVDYDYQLKFAELARQNKIYTFVLLSASKADRDSKFFYSRMKGCLEDGIKALNFPRLIILQPGPIDRPHTERKAEKIMFSVLKFLNKFGLFKNYSPIGTIPLAQIIIDIYFQQKDESYEIYDSQYILKKSVEI